MRYRVTHALRIGDATSVTIKGNGRGLKNGMIVEGDDGKKYHIRSVGMVNSAESIAAFTTVLIEGEFDLDSFIIGEE